MTRKEAEKRARASAHYQAKGAIHTHEQKKPSDYCILAAM